MNSLPGRIMEYPEATPMRALRGMIREAVAEIRCQQLRRVGEAKR